MEIIDRKGWTSKGNTKTREHIISFNFESMLHKSIIRQCNRKKKLNYIMYQNNQDDFSQTKWIDEEFSECNLDTTSVRYTSKKNRRMEYGIFVWKTCRRHGSPIPWDRRARDFVPGSCVSFMYERPERDTANVNETTGQLLRSRERDNPRGN